MSVPINLATVKRANVCPDFVRIGSIVQKCSLRSAKTDLATVTQGNVCLRKEAAEMIRMKAAE